MKIAVSGKGGVGKTTVSAGLVECFAASGKVVYAIDADPDASLGVTLGLDPAKLNKQVPLIEMKELIDAKNAGGGAFVDLNPDVTDVLAGYAIDQGNIRFFRMGGVKQGGSACYCKENSFLQSILNSLLLDKKEPVLIDMSAGIEHLTRGTARGVELVLVVTEPSVTSVNTARLTEKLARDLGIKRIMFLGNKVKGDDDKIFLEDAFSPDAIAGMLPYSEAVLAAARSTGSQKSGYLAEMISKVWNKIGEVND